MFGFGKKVTIEDTERLYQEELKKIQERKKEKEDRNESIRRHYVDFIKNHLEPLPDDTLHMIFTQAVFQMCYESFLQKVDKNYWEEKVTLDWDESNLASVNVKVVIDKFREHDRKLKGRFAFYMMEACKEIIEYREKLSEEMRKGEMNKNEETSGS
jgi:hypothetical protein